MRRLLLILLCSLLPVFHPLSAAITPFTERTQVDFDSTVKLLQPYGSWSETGTGADVWQFSPNAGNTSYVPMTEGRWVYTDWGWMLQSTEPHAWATFHYGFWVRHTDGTWAWQPDPNWHPATVDFRASKDYIAWRPSRLDRAGELAEPEANLNTPEEWILLPRGKFGLPFTRADVITGPAAKALFSSTDWSFHIFIIWEKVERPGPDPMEFAERLKIPNTDSFKNIPLEVTDTDGNKLKPTRIDYYTIMTLPTLDTPPPRDAKLNEIYLYRPTYFQDKDGIMRRIKISQNPQAQQQAIEQVNESLHSGDLAPLPTAPVTPTPSPAPQAAPDVSTPKRLK